MDDQAIAAEKRRLLAETRADLLKRQLSNSENHDRAVLSLSTIFLGFSLAFLKDLAPGHSAVWIWVLYSSWIALAGAVLTTMASFWISQRAIDVQLKRAEDYYGRDDQTAFAKTGMAKLIEWVNGAAGLLFLIGVVLTTVFVISNFERGLNMSNERKGTPAMARDGATIPRMQEIVKKGATIPNMQPAPQTQPPQSQPAQPAPAAPPAGGGQSGGNKK